MKELFSSQYEYANPIDEDVLDEIPLKNYTSGEEKKSGDIPLWGFKACFNLNEDVEELTLELFTLCEREFPYYRDQYTVIRNPIGQMNIPIFIKKGDEEKYETIKNDHLKIKY